MQLLSNNLIANYNGKQQGINKPNLNTMYIYTEMTSIGDIAEPTDFSLPFNQAPIYTTQGSVRRNLERHVPVNMNEFIYLSQYLMPR